MTLELKPLGNSCNLGCTYCYQEPMRKAGNVRASKTYDLDLMMDIADESGLNIGYTVFGGEALLVPKKDLEKLFKRSYEKYGSSSLQTNGSLIDDDHIALFQKYNVSVGVSVDGPNDLNGLRLSLNKKKTTDEMTQQTMNNLLRLKQCNVRCSIIITVHKLNGTKETLPRLLNFLRWVRDIGINSGNIHMLEVDSKNASSYALSSEENEHAFITLANFFGEEENRDLHFEPFNEMEQMQRSNDTFSSCIWKSCDPMNTGAVYGIEGNGQLSNCGMVNKEGIEWTKADDQIKLRDLILYQTPPENGGCNGCEFFLMCNGYCPGSSNDSDWRNKTYYCGTLKKMFKYYEDKVEQSGQIPFSKRKDRKELERIYIDSLLIDPQNRLSMKNLEESSKKVRVINVISEGGEQ